MGACWVIHHIGILALDLGASRRFYVAALAPLGISVGFESDDTVELWRPSHDTPSLSLERADGAPTRGAHLAFTADGRNAVDAFFGAAMDCGGRERHAPRLWPEYRAFCAFVSDPDGNNVEAVHKELS